MTTLPLTGSRSAVITFVVLTLAAVGCQPGDGPTAPVGLRCPAARVSLCTDVARAAFLRAAVADAGTRLAPALQSATARGALATRLDALSARLADGDVTGSLAALRDTRAALAEARAQLAAHPEDDADLAAIELTLTETAGALGAP